MDIRISIPKKSVMFLKGLQCVTLICGVLILVSCSDASMESSKLQHTYGQISRDFPAFSWYNLETAEEEETYRFFMSSMLGQKLRLLPSDSATVQRLNYWVDLIDTTLREKYPDQLKNIPAPKVWVADSKIENAFVSMMPVCYKIPIVKDMDTYVAAKAVGGSQLEEISLMFSFAHKDGVGLIPKYDCLSAKDSSPETLNSILNLISTKHPNCKMHLDEFEGSSYVKIDDCPDIKVPLIDSLGGFSSFAVTSIPNRLIFLAGMLESLRNEAHVVSIIAHEISHYYKAHIEVLADEVSSEYDYPYEIGETNSSKKPLPSEDAQILDLGAKLAKLSYARYEISRIPGQKLRSELFDISMAMVVDIASKQSCDENTPGCNTQCKNLLTWLKNPKNHVVWSSVFPTPINMKPEYKAQYFEYENQVLSCFSGVSIGEDPERIKNGTHIKSEDFTSKINLLSKFANKPDLLDGMVFEGNVLDAIQKAELKLLEEYANKDALLEEGYQKNVGIYTKEQEADEMSVEILHEIGFNLKAAVHLYLTLAVKTNERFELYGIDPYPHTEKLVSCLALHNNGWKTPDGKPYFVNIGDYTDSHHSACFRAYNLDREIEAHPEYNTVVNKETKKLLSDSEFDELLEEITTFRDSHKEADVIFIIL